MSKKKLIVMKFGGTSVVTGAARAACIGHIRKAVNEGSRVAVVVSAMGREGDPYATDTLLAMAPELDLQGRDMMMSCGEVLAAGVLASELCAAGLAARPLTGGEAGLRSDGRFGAASIIGMNTDTVIAMLEHGMIPVIAGFQGLDGQGHVNTLGRGGSDTSAVAVAGYLDADRTILFTDVNGVALCDPRLVPQAPYVRQMDSQDALTLMRYGDKVVHPRAIQAAIAFGLTLSIDSTFASGGGTVIRPMRSRPQGLVGVAVTRAARIHKRRTIDALACGSEWMVPGAGKQAVITILHRGLTAEQRHQLAALGTLQGDGELTHLVVDGGDVAAKTRAVYAIAH